MPVDMWGELLDQLGWVEQPAAVHRWKPVEWAESRGLSLWSAQRRILEAIAAHRNVAVHSHHAAGKTFTAALAVSWWIDSRTPGKARAFTTAPTFFQVRSLLWTEMGRLHGQLGLKGRCNQTELVVPDPSGRDFLAAWGRKPSDHDKAAFQGVHDEEGVLAVADEACGIPASILEDLEKNLTGPDDRMLLIGNPDDPTSLFARICRGEIPGWHVIHLDAYVSPNWTGEQVPPAVARSLISKEWAAAQATKYGDQSPTYLARVRGMFPAESSDAVIPLSFLARVRDPADGNPDKPRVLGVDVGATGDRTKATLRVGMAVAETHTPARTSDSAQLVNDLVDIITSTQAEEVRIDSIGIGWGVAGALAQARADGRHHAVVSKVNVAERAHDPGRFVNRRSELWWLARERCESGDWDLSAATGDALEQLSWPKWDRDPRGRIRVERKEDTISRHGHSPDDADSVLLCWADGPTSVGPVGLHGPPRPAGRPDVNWFGARN